MQYNPKSNLGMNNFYGSLVETAWTYHRQIDAGDAKGCVPVEIAAFIAGACWAQQLLDGGEKEDKI